MFFLFAIHQKWSKVYRCQFPIEWCFIGLLPKTIWKEAAETAAAEAKALAAFAEQRAMEPLGFKGILWGKWLKGGDDIVWC